MGAVTTTLLCNNAVPVRCSCTLLALLLCLQLLHTSSQAFKVRRHALHCTPIVRCTRSSYATLHE